MSQPNLALTFEPQQSLVEVSYLRCAPSAANGQERGYLNLGIAVKNNETEPIRVTKVEISIPNSTTPAQSWNAVFPPADASPIGPNATRVWTQPDDHLFVIPPGPLSVRVKISAVGDRTRFTDPLVVAKSILPHAAPTADGSYRFWGKVRDLRPGEFWQVHGTAHGQAWSQLFAYDVGVSVESGSSHDGRMPGTDGKKNEHSRIWGKPIYAIANGKVVHFRNDFPTNPRPLQAGEKYEDVFPDLYDQWNALGDGNGNFFTIETGAETVLYAHMQAGSLNPALLSAGATVKAGDYLGRAGNSGASSGPHLHIHANKTIAGDAKSWDNAPRPMPMRGCRAIAWAGLTSDASSGAWVKLDGRGIPADNCAIWPSDEPVVDLRDVVMRHFAISEQGQLWVVRGDNAIRTTGDALPGEGVFLGVNPGGSAREVAVSGQKPYVIGMDGRVFEGLPNGWFPIPGSPECKRITTDVATGRLWLVTAAGEIVMFDPVARTWTTHAGGGVAKDVCAANGVPFVIGTDDGIWKSAGAAGWAPLPGEGRAKRIAIDHRSNKIWVVGANNGIWSHAGGGNWTEHPGGGVAKDVAIFNRVPYVIGSDNGLWRSAGAAGWHRLNLVEPN